MRTYIVKYITLEGYVEEVEVEAVSKEDAKVRLKKEYWDVREILRIRQL